MELPTLNTEPVTQAPPGTIRAVCVEIDQPSSWEQWPTYFLYPPREGESVKSATGRVARIVNVMHIMGAAGMPVVVLELTRDTGGSTPVEGGPASIE